jgi:hypothetical protein
MSFYTIPLRTVYFTVLLNVSKVSAIMLRIIMLSIIMLSIVMLSIVMLSIIMLSIIMLSIVMLSVVLLTVVAPKLPESQRRRIKDSLIRFSNCSIFCPFRPDLSFFFASDRSPSVYLKLQNCSCSCCRSYKTFLHP